MRLPEHEPEMREQVAREKGDDVQFGPQVRRCRKYPAFCHKMPVYATHRDPTFVGSYPRQVFPT
jgi:hypothetical protein